MNTTTTGTERSTDAIQLPLADRTRYRGQRKDTKTSQLEVAPTTPTVVLQTAATESRNLQVAHPVVICRPWEVVSSHVSSEDAHSDLDPMYAPTSSCSADDLETDRESVNPLGSTIADVIASPRNVLPDDTIDPSSVTFFVEPRLFCRTDFLSSSRWDLKKGFHEAEPFCLPKWHPTIALANWRKLAAFLEW